MSTFKNKDGRWPVCCKCRHILRPMTDEELVGWDIDLSVSSQWVAFLPPKKVPYGDPCSVGSHRTDYKDLIPAAIEDLMSALCNLS